MKTTILGSAKCALALFVAAAFLAGCGGGSPSQLSPVNPDGLNNTQSRHVHSLQTVSTKVAVYNSWTQTIFGTSRPPSCWSISPSSLPSVAAGATSSAITLSYDTTCASDQVLSITYGPLVTPNQCTFAVAYNGTKFTYSVSQSGNTDCSAYLSNNVLVNEILQYGQSS